MHGVEQRGNQPPRGNFSANPADLTVLMWNVRGINSEKKQRYLSKLINEERPDVAMFNETKLTSSLYLDGYHSFQTLFKRSGGLHHLHQPEEAPESQGPGYLPQLDQGPPR